MTQNTKPSAPMAYGDQISYSPCASVIITLQRVNLRAYNVTTMCGPRRLDDWSRSYATEIEARSAARHVALAFREWGCEAAINAARHGIEQKRYRALNSRASWAQRVLEEAGAALDAIATLADRAAYLAAIAG